MRSTPLTAMLLALVAQALSSPVTAPPATATCVINMLKEPSIEENCTLDRQTVTKTRYTECHGCALHTQYLGVGVPCRKMTTVPGTYTETVVACAPTPSPY